jgi:hypothetical protein
MPEHLFFEIALSRRLLFICQTRIITRPLKCFTFYSIHYYINENRGYCSIDENRVSEVTMKGELRIEFQSQMALI